MTDRLTNFQICNEEGNNVSALSMKAAVQATSSKLCKLIQHVKTQPKNYAGEDIALCPRDFPFIVENDVVEIYNPEDDSPRLLLRITKSSLRDDFTHKDAISIEQSIASQFQLKNFPDVVITKVDESTVELDSLELTFKDQYLGRSEMWRLKNSLVNACIYLNKKIEFACSTIRCTVYEMWLHGNKVSSGVVTPATKIVFRSSSSMVYLFIQMSSEMWDFDIYGDLYFEKAVNGFLAELFRKWKKNGSNHEVTIVLFSRLYYQANSLEQFSDSLRQCLQTDYKGRFYEDYYRVAVQNEKYEDWGSVLTHLKHLFVEYQSSILNAHLKDNSEGRNPRAYISSAAQGNVLEVLNMSLNVFEKHYLDRSLDRTGQLSVVITPGVGVFEVDRELSNLTMQRVIDNGVGSDLVCVGEQPLHAVPLLKFHNKNTSPHAEDYSMPHWINQSFYSSNKKVGYSSYIPRIKLPTRSLRRSSLNKTLGWDSTNAFGEAHFPVPKPKQNQVDSYWPNSVYDFDDYDSKVFQVPNAQSLPRRNLHKKRTTTLSEVCLAKAFHRQNSEPEIFQGGSDFNSTFGNTSLSSSVEKSSMSTPLTSTPAITIPNKALRGRDQMYSSSFGTLNFEMKSKTTTTKRGKWYYDDLSAQSLCRNASFGYTSHGGSPKEDKTVYSRHSDSRVPSKALINPFDPSHAVIKLTSNRRRWTHIFPRGPSGVLIQQHHFQSNYPKLEIVHESIDSPESPKSTSDGTGSIRSGNGRQSVPRQGSSEGTSGKQKLTLLWGATGEQEWSCALQTGVDWKSLTIPACLPITTDYFPDERSLQIDYVVSDYNLLPDLSADYLQQKTIYRSPLTPNEVFQELVSQRLAQGFQLIIKSSSTTNKTEKSAPKFPPQFLNSSVSRSNVFVSNEKEKEEYFLSIGRVFHKISLDGSTINVTRYRPRFAYPSIKIHYRYQFHGPNNSGYEISCANFCTEKLENYNWNYLDHYICTRGDRDFILMEALKYWRFRMMLLPSFQAPSKKVHEGTENLNVYAPLGMEDKCNLVDSFMKFVEVSVNRRIRRPNSSGKKVFGLTKPINPLGFRERLGSNRIERRPFIRSGERGSSVKTEGESSQGETEPALAAVEGAPEVSPQSQEKHDDEGGYRLTSDASIQAITDALRTPSSGLSFVKCDDLPKFTFVSSDAVLWLMTNMDGIESEAMAAQKFEEMLNQRLICHASGNLKHPFIVGFYLYFFPYESSGPKAEEDLEAFQNEWMEVKIDYDRIKPAEPPPHWSRKVLDHTPDSHKSKAEASYCQVYVDVDVGKKSDRQEWSHLRYQPVYRPDEAFEIVIQWVQATGSIITELVQSWSRKAQQCNLQLIPIPNDPFAFLSSAKSDSLRGPIFVPLNVDSLMGRRSYLFEEFPEDTWDERLLLFQHEIVQHFAFISMTNMDSESSCRSKDRHYIHASGNMFILVQSRDASMQGLHIKESPHKSQRFNESPVANSQDNYITRHVSGKNRDLIQEERIGFLWSWNYMISKRWKTSSTHVLGDDSFTLKLLKDFTSFCDNQNNRLTKFWETKVAENS